MTDDGNQKYVWDELKRLIQVKDSGNSLIVDYYYNADNLRVEKHHAGGLKEQFYYDGVFIVEDQDGSQSLVREYMQGGQYVDEIISVKTGGSYYYCMYDLRFNEYGFVDSTGAIVERARYDGYGKRTLMDNSYTTITTPVVDQPFSYTGQRLDTESGLQYYRARYFDNDLGRFINRDPIGYVDGLNLYRGYFVVNGMDWSGLKPSKVIYKDYPLPNPRPVPTWKDIISLLSTNLGEHDFMTVLSFKRTEMECKPTLCPVSECPGGKKYTCTGQYEYKLEVTRDLITLPSDDLNIMGLVSLMTFEQQKKWDTFVAAVLEHELGHQSISRELVGSFNLILSNPYSFKGSACLMEDAAKAANKQADDLLESLKADWENQYKIYHDIYHLQVGESITLEIYLNDN